MTYRAPVAEMFFTMRHVAGLDRAIAEGLYGDLTPDLVETILEEAGRFANEAIAPLNRVGDQRGAVFKDGAVTMPPGFKEAYRAWSEAGWNALPGPVEYGGQGLPTLLNSGLRRDVERGLHGLRPRPAADDGRHRGAGRARLGGAEGALPRKARLRRMDGDHEPDRAAGRLRSRRAAHPRRAGGRRHATGSPARRSSSPTASTISPTTSSIWCWRACPTRPPGTRGISLFLVPKVLARRHAQRRALPVGIEHKLGIHASPTCTMIYRRRRRRDRLA